MGSVIMFNMFSAYQRNAADYEDEGLWLLILLRFLDFISQLAMKHNEGHNQNKTQTTLNTKAIVPIEIPYCITKQKK